MQDHTDFVVSADSIYTLQGLVSLALRIKDGRIHSMGDVHAYDHITCHHFAGCTISPCFCDHHLHFFHRPSSEEKKGIDDLIGHGVAYAWDGGGPDGHGLVVRDKVKGTLFLRSAGSGLYKKGSYGKQIGTAVDSVREAKKAIDRLAEEGADYIKIVNSGIFLPETGKISTGGFLFKELDRIIEYARRKSLEVFCHANGKQAVEDAVIAGADAIIHGLDVSDETLGIMSERGVAFIPTVYAFESLRKISKSGQALKNIDQAVGRHLSAIKKAEERGVKILAGSDAGPSFIPYGESYFSELTMFRKAGLSMQGILSSAAQGYIQKGMKADLLVLDGLAVKKIFIGGAPVAVRTL